MTMKATEKMIEALTLLFEGYTELQETIENELEPGSPAISTDEDDADDDEDEESDADALIVAEVRAALEAVIENEDYTPDDMASLVSTMTEALEEIAPDVFAEASDSDEDEDDDDSYEEEEEDYDEDDDEYDEDDDDELDEEEDYDDEK